MPDPFVSEVEPVTDPACEECAATGEAIVTCGDRELCESCASEAGYARCDDCEDWEQDTASVSSRSRGGNREESTLCPSCLDSGAFICARARCGDAWRDRNGVEVDGATWCPGCAEDESFLCDACDRRFPNDSRGSSCEANGHERCENCDACDCDDPPEETDADTANYRMSPASAVPTIPDTVRFGMEIECRMPTAPHDWPTHRDGSLDGHGELEAVSPILCGTDGLRRLRGAVGAMERGGCGPARNGGIHVHVSRTSPYTVRDVYRIVWHWTEWGEDFASYVVPGFRLAGGPYNAPMVRGHGCDSRGCDSDGAATYRAIETYAVGPTRDGGDRWSLAAATSRMPTGGARWRTLNLEALGEHGTVEFRLYPSCPAADPATLYASLSARFVAFAVATDPDRVRAAVARHGAGRFGLRALGHGSPRFVELWNAERARVERGDGFQATVRPSPVHEVGRDPWGRARRSAASPVGWLPGFHSLALGPAGSPIPRPGETAATLAAAPEPAPAPEPEPETYYRGPCGAGFTRADLARADVGTRCVLAGSCPFAHECRIGATARPLPERGDPSTWARILPGCRCYACQESRAERSRVPRANVQAGRTARVRIRDVRAVSSDPGCRERSIARARAMRGPGRTPRIFASSDVARRIHANRTQAGATSLHLWYSGAILDPVTGRPL